MSLTNDIKRKKKQIEVMEADGFFQVMKELQVRHLQVYNVENICKELKAHIKSELFDLEARQNKYEQSKIDFND